MTDQQTDFLSDAAAAATSAVHPFPEMAACEAALESAWGNSELAREANNLFGMKLSRVSPNSGKFLALPTREFEHGQWFETTAKWAVYESWADCFEDRAKTLHRLSSVFLHYHAALDATDPMTYITEVSKTWSTDPNRAAKVISIYQEWQQWKTQNSTQSNA